MTQPFENVKDKQECIFPDVFLELFDITEIKNQSESLVLLLHSFLLEVGFFSKDVEQDATIQMPENWNTASFYKIHYYHKSLPDALCWVTFVPLCGKLTIQGTSENEQVENSAYWTLDVKAHLNVEGKLSDPYSLFSHVTELSRKFKDGFCFPLLVHLQESAQCKPTFGLSGLVDEVKTVILKMLPVESIVSLSSVNKDFYDQANAAFLWKYLFIRDYGSESASGSSVSENWKETYKNEYRRRKTRHAFRPHLGLYHPYHLPQIYPVGPNFNADLRINMDPALQEAFPYMRARFRPSNLYFPPRYPYFEDF